MSAREDILGAVRAALHDVPSAEAPVAEPEGYDVSLTLARPELLSLFCDRVDDYRATVRRAPRAEVSAQVADVLAGRVIRTLAAPPGLPPEWLPESVEVIRDDGALTADRLDTVDGVITAAAVGIALTGTLVLDAGAADQGRRLLSLVPDYHLCVIDESAVVGTVPEAIARLRPDRPLTLISGPSATSDIELDRVEGVHGPRTLDVLLLE